MDIFLKYNQKTTQNYKKKLIYLYGAINYDSGRKGVILYLVT